MKKGILLLIVCTFLVAPLTASASVLSNISFFFKWLVPQEVQPPAPPAPITEKGVGGILITPSPVVLSGDTSRSFYLPALTSRTFRIQNEGAIDLFLNKNSKLSYEAEPNVSPGDVPNSFALSVGADRTIIISNPSSAADMYLSKTDLGVVSTGTSSQPVIFISKTQAKAAPVQNGKYEPTIASFDFGFTFNNATNKDVYVSKLINPPSFVALSEIVGATTTVKFIDSSKTKMAGDTPSVYVIPAGSNRPFEVTGIIDNTHGKAGEKILTVTEIHYSNNPDLSSPQALSGPIQLRNLTLSVFLNFGALPRTPTTTPTTGTTTPGTVVPGGTGSTTPTGTQKPTKPVVSASPSPKPSSSSTPSPSSTPTTTPSTSPSPSGSASPSPSGSPATTTGMVITIATTTIGDPIIEDEEIIGYPVTFSFTVEARGKTVYFSKDPAVAFMATSTGFGSIVPFINNISSSPAIRTGDGGSYYVIPVNTTRSFQAFAVIKSDGLIKAGTQTFQITRVNYGTKTTSYNDAWTSNANLKATVRLSPRIFRPSPTPSPSTSPSGSPSTSPSPSTSASQSPSPSASSLIALCYAVPTNPYTNDLVTWQVMQTGGTGTASYTWTGTDNLTGSTASLARRYTTAGRKDALVSVVVGSQSITATCNVTVILSPSPSYSPASSTSSSASPSPSGSGSAFGPSSRGLVAGALYSMGEWLDSLFER